MKQHAVLPLGESNQPFETLNYPRNQEVFIYMNLKAIETKHILTNSTFKFSTNNYNK